MQELYLDKSSGIVESAQFVELNQTFLDDIEAVSYTHLDVYKRQHWNYSVEFELVPGGLDSIYSSPTLEKCFEFVRKFMERNPTR